MNAASLEQRLDHIESMLSQLIAAFVVMPKPDVESGYVSPAREAQIRLLARQNSLQLRIEQQAKRERKRA